MSSATFATIAERAAAENRPPRVALLYLCRPYVVKEFADSVGDLLNVDRTRGWIGERVLRQKCAPYPDIFRNMMTMEAFRRWPDVEIVFWLDDDSGFEPEDFYRVAGAVANVGQQIVSGLYFAVAHGGKVRPLVNRVVDTDEGCETVWQYPRGQLVGGQAHVGMGFCAIAATPLVRYAERHGPTWFDRRTTAKGKRMIEDSSFCLTMREQGCEIFVDTRTRITHWKTYPVTEETFDAQTALWEMRQRGNALG